MYINEGIIVLVGTYTCMSEPPMKYIPRRRISLMLLQHEAIQACTYTYDACAMSLKRPRLPKLTLSIDVDEQEAELDRQVKQFSKDMAAVDRECLSQHLVDDVFVIKPVGRGASGMVHLACHAPTLRLLALKSVSVEDDVHEAAVMQELHAEHRQLVPLTSEGAPAWLFHHHRHIGDVHPCPQIASFYGSYADRENRRVWMALEYMEAGSLDHYCGCGVEALRRMSSAG